MYLLFTSNISMNIYAIGISDAHFTQKLTIFYTYQRKKRYYMITWTSRPMTTVIHTPSVSPTEQPRQHSLTIDARHFPTH